MSTGGLDKDTVWYLQAFRDEWIADAIVHIIGIALAISGCAVLIGLAVMRADASLFIGVGIYSAGLLTMLCCSALHNINTNENFRSLFGRVDMAAIFVMIAGTYTPFALLAIGGALGAILLATVWTIALLGAGLRLFTDIGTPKAFIGVYLVLGWLVVTALHPLLAALSAVGIALLVAGGLLYTIGVIFHVRERMRFNSAVWHAFVVGAATCHFAAVLREIVILS